MGADRMSGYVEPGPDVDPAALLADLDLDDGFEYTRVQDGLLEFQRYNHDRALVRRELQDQIDRIPRAGMIEISDTATSAIGYLYRRAGGELVLVDRIQGGENYGRDVRNYFAWRHGFDV